MTSVNDMMAWAIILLSLAENLITTYYFDEDSYGVITIALIFCFEPLLDAIVKQLLHCTKCTWGSVAYDLMSEGIQCFLFVHFCSYDEVAVLVLPFLMAGQIILMVILKIKELRDPPELLDVDVRAKVSSMKLQAFFQGSCIALTTGLFPLFYALYQEESPFRQKPFEMALAAYYWSIDLGLQYTYKALEDAVAGDPQALAKARGRSKTLKFQQLCQLTFVIYSSVLAWEYWFSPDIQETFDKVYTMMTMVLSCIAGCGVPCVLMSILCGRGANQLMPLWAMPGADDLPSAVVIGEREEDNIDPMELENGSSNAGDDANVKQNQDMKAMTQEQNVRANDELRETLDFLCGLRLFDPFPRDVLPLVAPHLISRTFEAGDVVAQMGNACPEFEFVLVKTGEASIQHDWGGLSTKVQTLSPGDYFWEPGKAEPCMAIITATSPMSVLSIPSGLFEQLGLCGKLQLPKRRPKGAILVDTAAPILPVPKTQEEKDLISDLISNASRKNDNFLLLEDSWKLTLNEESINRVVEVAWKEAVPKGKELFTENVGWVDHFYMVQDGCFEFYVKEEGENAGDNGKLAHSVSKGGSFGELELIYLTPPWATIRATTESTVWVMDPASFYTVMKPSPEGLEKRVKVLDRLGILSGLLSEEKEALANSLLEIHRAKGEVALLREESFHILYGGEVSIARGSRASERLVASDKVATYFWGGPKSQEETTSVTCVSETCKLLCLHPSSFNELLAPLGLFPHQEATDAVLGPCDNGGPACIPRRDLTKIGLIGCGGFGSVELVEHKGSKETYAMKSISKGYTVKTGTEKNVMDEKRVMQLCNSPFIIKLHATYNGLQTLYFCMEAALGGNLYDTYNRQGFYGNQPLVKFHLAGIILGLEYMHERHIIYRSANPENIVLSAAGKVKLCDMGMAKFVVCKTYTMCGVPEYMAPEMILKTGQTRTIDFWQIGIMLFELLYQTTPFDSDCLLKIRKKVSEGIENAYPQKSRQGLQGELIRGFVKNDPDTRLSISKAKSMKWYKGFDWDAMASGSMEPPYCPSVSDSKDISNFFAKTEDLPLFFEYHETGTGWDAHFATC